MGGTGQKLALMARSGYAARGVVYLIVGGLAVLAALGRGGQTTGTRGALTTLLAQPFGQVLLGIVALGLVGYALWRVVQALADVDGHGTDGRGLAVRAGLLVSAVTHSLLALFALSLIFGWGSSIGSDDDSGARNWTAWLLQQPFGRWLVGLLGLAIVAAGIAHMIKGYRARFERYLQMDAATLEKVSPVCRFGLIARGVVFVIIGGFLIVAAFELDSAQARGLQGALQTLQQQPYGWLLLGVVALGLAAFGGYSLIEAWYRRIDLPHPTVPARIRAGHVTTGRMVRQDRLILIRRLQPGCVQQSGTADLDEEHRLVLVHRLHEPDVASAVALIKSRYEQPLKEILG